MEFGHAPIEVDASVGIGGCVDALTLVEDVGLPVGELSALRDALAEEVGPKLLKAKVFDAHAGCNMLEVNPSGGVKTFATLGQHAPVVVER